MTEKGLGLRPEVTVISERIFESLFTDINDDEREAFRNTLMKMIQNMQQDR